MLVSLDSSKRLSVVWICTQGQEKPPTTFKGTPEDLCMASGHVLILILHISPPYFLCIPQEATLHNHWNVEIQKGLERWEPRYPAAWKCVKIDSLLDILLSQAMIEISKKIFRNAISFLIRRFTHFIDASQLLYILPCYIENASYFVKPKTSIESRDKLCFIQWTLTWHYW